MLELTFDELIVAYKFFRTAKELGGIEYNKEVMKKILVGMVILGEKAKDANFDRNTTWPIGDVEEDDLWRITRQSDIIDYQRGSVRCGYTFIEKVAKELVEDELPNLWTDDEAKKIGDAAITELNNTFIKNTENV